MKKAIIATAVFLALGVSNIAQADNHTVTLGYAQSTVQNFDDIDGINVKYRYEWDSPLSIILILPINSGHAAK